MPKRLTSAFSLILIGLTSWDSGSLTLSWPLIWLHRV
jgi:hypothetical protein